MNEHELLLKVTNLAMEITRQVTLRNPTFLVECVALGTAFYFPTLRLRVTDRKTGNFYDQIIDNYVLSKSSYPIKELAHRTAIDMCEVLIRVNL